MKIPYLAAYAAGLVLSMACMSTVQAALVDRGSGMIYDDVLDITWLQDANYTYTSGYVGSNPAGNGLMGYTEANSWAQSLIFGGFEDWRLPTIDNGASGELYHLFMNNLGGNCTSATSCDASFANGGDASDIRTFQNIQFVNPGYETAGGGYWYNDLYPTPVGVTLYYVFSQYSSSNMSSTNFPLNFAWAVRDGDVIPIPPAIWLFGSGLLGLIGVARRKKVT